MKHLSHSVHVGVESETGAMTTQWLPWVELTGFLLGADGLSALTVNLQGSWLASGPQN